jgi:hypothetical protein
LTELFLIGVRVYTTGIKPSLKENGVRGTRKVPAAIRPAASAGKGAEED